MRVEENDFSNESSFPRFIKLGDKIIDTSEQAVLKGQEATKLEPLSFSFLMFLVSNQQRTVSRDMLLEKVWNNRVVTDDALRKVVRKLRLALEDDAKKPSYIKTVPGLGYELVAIPRSVDKALPTTSNSYKKVYWPLGTLFLIFIAFLISDFVIQSKEFVVDGAQVKVEPLTHFPNDELSGSYNHPQNQLLFTYKESNSENFHIYIKNLKTQLIKKLTNDRFSYKTAVFSPDGKRIAYSRIEENGMRIYTASFDTDSLMKNTELIPTENDANGLLSWSSNGEYIYSTNDQNFISGSRGIYRTHVKTKKTEAITFPNLRGGGDYFAKESPSGKLLAVLRTDADRKFRIIIVDLVERNIKQESSVSFFPYRLIWGDETNLVISGAKGEFYDYSVRENTFKEKLKGRVDLSGVFYQCGNNCYFMTRNTQNYTNIKEIDNPYFQRGTEPLIQIDTGGAEFHPTYSPDGKSIVYTAKDQSSVKLILQGKNSNPVVLYEGKPNTVIKNLSFNFQMTKLVGKLETQIFVLDLETKELRFITSQLALAGFPSWGPSGNNIYFSKEHNNKTSLYKYDLEQDREEKSYDDIVSIHFHSPNLTFIVDTNKQLFRLVDDGSRKFITKLQNATSDHWHVIDNFLYFSQVEAGLVSLMRLDLDSQTIESKPLNLDPAWSRFSIDEESKRLLVTETLSRQRDIVKVHW